MGSFIAKILWGYEDEREDISEKSVTTLTSKQPTSSYPPRMPAARLFVAPSLAKFTVDLYQKQPTQQNIILSPSSISIALALTYIGARGDTAKQMKTGMRFDGIKDDDIHKGFEGIQTQMAGADHEVKLLFANGLFLDKYYKFEKEYLATAKLYYQAEFISADFRYSPEESIRCINSWVEDKTQKKINNILASGSVDSMDRMILVNAIYFKGDWAKKFQECDTRKDDFFVNPDETTQVLFMYQDGDFNYGYNPKLDSFALELPYVDRNVSMFILLPKLVDGLQQLEAQLSEADLNDPEGTFQMRISEISIKIPRFRVDHSIRLKDTLGDMGIKDLFDKEKADLRGIGFNGEDLFVGNLLHKAFIEVNEEGSEAAAVTMTDFCLKGIIENEEFFAEHPFLFFIRYNSTKTILFLGRFFRPEEENCEEN